MIRLVEEYAAALPIRPKLRGAGVVTAKHAAEELAHLRAAVAAMRVADLPAAELTALEVRGMLAMEATRPATARARFGALSRFFDWAQDAGLVPANPCALIGRGRRPRPPPSRAHFLTPADLARLWHAAGGLAPVHRDLVRLLIALPCRRSEAARLDWAHLDLAAGEWRIPGQLTKYGDLHRLHLHSLAREVLLSRHEGTGAPHAGLVFPAPLSGKPVDTFSDLKATLEDASGLRSWTWHDFRRSFATALGEQGFAEPVVDAVLNHRQAATRGGVLGVYQRSLRWPEQVAVITAWGDRLMGALSAWCIDRPLGSVEAKVESLRAAEATRPG